MARITGKPIETLKKDLSKANFLNNPMYLEPERVATPQQGLAETMFVAQYTNPIANDLYNDNFIHQLSLITNLPHNEIIKKLGNAEFTGNPFQKGKFNV